MCPSGLCRRPSYPLYYHCCFYLLLFVAPLASALRTELVEDVRKIWLDANFKVPLDLPCN